MKYKIVRPDDFTEVEDYTDKLIKAYSSVSAGLELALVKVDLLANVMEENDGNEAAVNFLRNITEKYK